MRAAVVRDRNDRDARSRCGTPMRGSGQFGSLSRPGSQVCRSRGFVRRGGPSGPPAWTV